MRGMLLVALLGVGGCNRSPVAAVDTADDTAVPVTAETLFGDYQKDATAADSKYRHTPVRLSGRIQRLTIGPPAKI